MYTLPATPEALERLRAEREEADRRDSAALTTAAVPVPAAVTRLGPVIHVGFGDGFRGARDAIRVHQAEHVPLVAGATGVLDLGCGRGEFLALRTHN